MHGFSVQYRGAGFARHPSPSSRDSCSVECSGGRCGAQALGGRAPEVLIGHSLGGKVALEWLQQLASGDRGLGLPQQVKTRVLGSHNLQNPCQQCGSSC